MRYIQKLTSFYFYRKNYRFVWGRGSSQSWQALCALRIIYNIFEKFGATIVGDFPVEGYDFEHSPAVRDGKFVGLPIDEVNQSELKAKIGNAFLLAEALTPDC